MSEDFRAKVTAELDTAAAESKLEAFLNKNNKLKIDATTAQDIKWGRYIIVCKVFFAKRFPISFKKIDTTTADTFVMINLIILNQSVFLNAVQNAAVANIFWKCAKPTKLGDPTGL